MYFSMFPKMDYDLLGNNTTNRFTNITKRAFISNHVRKNIVNFDFYDVVDGESPEIIADLYYENVFLHWLVSRYYYYVIVLKIKTSFLTFM